MMQNYVDYFKEHILDESNTFLKEDLMQDFIQKMTDQPTLLHFIDVKTTSDLSKGTKVGAEIRIPQKVLDDLAFTESFPEQFVQMIGQRVSLDLEELLINGDKGSGDPYLQLEDGLIACSEQKQNADTTEKVVLCSGDASLNYYQVDGGLVFDAIKKNAEEHNIVTTALSPNNYFMFLDEGELSNIMLTIDDKMEVDVALDSEGLAFYFWLKLKIDIPVTPLLKHIEYEAN